MTGRRPPPPLSPELEALLAPHRALAPVPPLVAARAVARAAAARELPMDDPGRVSSRPRWVFAAAAGAVLVLGAGAYAARAWIAEPASPVAPPVPLLASPRAGEPPSHLVNPVSPASVAPAPTAGRARRSVGRITAAPVRPTNAELQILLVAREDVTAGDFVGALTMVAEHVRRFRNGALVEEREALRIKSLAGLGRREEAQRAAAAFHARFPHSVFFSTFERMKEADR
jgi:hypothetical protein